MHTIFFFLSFFNRRQTTSRQLDKYQEREVGYVKRLLQQDDCLTRTFTKRKWLGNDQVKSFRQGPVFQILCLWSQVVLSPSKPYIEFILPFTISKLTTRLITKLKMTAYATLGREAQEGFYQTSQWFKEDQRVITVKMWGVGRKRYFR